MFPSFVCNTGFYLTQKFATQLLVSLVVELTVLFIRKCCFHGRMNEDKWWLFHDKKLSRIFDFSKTYNFLMHKLFKNIFFSFINSFALSILILCCSLNHPPYECKEETFQSYVWANKAVYFMTLCAFVRVIKKVCFSIFRNHT